MKCDIPTLLDFLNLGEKMLATQEFTQLSSLKQEKSNICIQGASKGILVGPRICFPTMRT
jgi:hypothetical protein